MTLLHYRKCMQEKEAGYNFSQNVANKQATNERFFPINPLLAPMYNSSFSSVLKPIRLSCRAVCTHKHRKIVPSQSHPSRCISQRAHINPSKPVTGPRKLDSQLSRDLLPNLPTPFPNRILKSFQSNSVGALYDG